MASSLNDAFDRFDGPTGWAPDGLEHVARLLHCDRPVSLRQCIERAKTFDVINVLDPPLRIATQNLGLFPAAAIEFSLPDSIETPSGVSSLGIMPLYKGKERHLALPTLEAWLRIDMPDVVVFTEFWVKDEKQSFAARMQDVYPHAVAGPDEDAPRPIELEVFDGGQLVLSRFPISEWHQTVFRQCAGEDCFVNKGALHIRLAHPTLPDGCDIFSAHMQSCPPEFGDGWIGSGPGNCAETLHIHQTFHLRDFVQAYADPTRPAFLLGDLNHNGNAAVEYGPFVTRLEMPQDIWLTAGNGAGITSDAKGSFQHDRAPRHPDDSERLKSGSRLDYVLAWPTTAAPRPIEVLPLEAELIRVQTSPGRDLSDHYGVVASIGAIGRMAIDQSETIQSVRLYARGLRCLRETGGPISMVSEAAGSDEIIATVSFTRESDGKRVTVEKHLDGLDTGEWKFFAEQLCVGGWPDSGYIDVSARLKEDDPAPGGASTGTLNLGERHLRLSRSELLLYRGIGQVPRTLPLFRGGGGEYAMTIAVEVE